MGNRQFSGQCVSLLAIGKTIFLIYVVRFLYPVKVKKTIIFFNYFCTFLFDYYSIVIYNLFDGITIIKYRYYKKRSVFTMNKRTKKKIKRFLKDLLKIIIITIIFYLLASIGSILISYIFNILGCL